MKADDSHALDDLLEKLADGDPIDWDQAATRASTSADRGLLRQLKVLEALRDTHRSTSVEGTDTMDVTPPRPATPTPTGHPRAGGRRWGRYRLVRHIGEGSYGAVYLAHDDELDRDLAIKLLHQTFARRAEITNRVKAEGRVLARVHHQHVVAVYDVEEHEHELGLCMEYIDGRSLDEIVRLDGPMNAIEAIAIGEAVCRGLAAVHAAGVVHRDVKARNVLRERAGRIVLMDLGAGLDRAHADPASPATNIGTPAYMAPELFEGESATRQSDIYSLGVLLYFLVTGEYPVAAASVDEIRKAHRTGRRTMLHERRIDLPHGFLRVVERATASDPTRRYETAGALLRELSTAGEAARGWVPLLQKTAAVAVAVPVLAILSGLLASRTFNRVLDRPAAFDPESLAGTVYVGFQAMVLPAVAIAVMIGASAILQIAFAVFPGLRRWWRRVWQRWAGYLDIPEHERAALSARAVVLGGFLALVPAWLAFGDVVWALTKSLSEDELDMFLSFRPENFARLLMYRLTLSALLFLFVVGWMGVGRVRQAYGGSVPVSVRAAAVGLVAFVLLFLQSPYKLMSPHNELQVVIVEDRRCLVIGQRDTGSRIYCPAWPVPRVRFIEAATPLEPCGFEENVFHEPRTAGCTRGTHP